MRIALVVPGGVDRSGESRVIPALLALIERLARSNDVQVFCLYQEALAAEWDLLGAHVVNVGPRQTRRRAIRAMRLRHRLAPFDVVHAIWSGTAGLVAAVAAAWIRRPCLIHVAGGEIMNLPDIGYGGMQNWRGRLRERWVLRRARVVTAASTPILDSLWRIGIHARRVPLGVDRRAWPPQPPRPRAANVPLRLVHVASLNRVKDQGLLLHAMAALVTAAVPFELHIVGEDTLDGEIHALAERLGLSGHVTFHGLVSHRALRPLIEAADLLVMTSRHETGPLVVLEAAMSGVPTVGTAVGHIAEWSPTAALAVPGGDAEKLARQIARLADDDERRLRIAAAAQVRALSDDADHTAQSFIALYALLAPAAAVTTVKV